jgi:serine/threonine protein kinase
MHACPSPEQLQQLLAQQLPPAARAALETHVEACATCQAGLEDLTAAMDSDLWRLRRAGDGADTPVLEPAYLERLRVRGADTPGPFRCAPTAAALPEVAGYEVLGELGRGGVSVVYRAWQPSLKRPVALKMLAAGALAGPEERAHFRAEAEVVARLRHPHIVQIYGLGETADCRPYLVLELMDGGTLAEQIAGTPQPLAAAVRLVETLARAVHCAHQHDIVHRDLKPANILLGRQKAEGRRQKAEPVGAWSPDQGPTGSLLDSDSCIPKISDFGLAKHLDGDGRQSRTGTVRGTPSYMAPEQAAGRSGAITPATDVYALGAILYELLTGRPPFRGETALDTLQQVRWQEPVSPSQFRPRLPRDLETICLTCLQKEPARRYVSALALADDLHRFQAGEPIRARPVSPWERGWKWARRRPAAAGLLAVSGLAVLALLAGGWWHDRQLAAAVRRAEAEHARAAANYRQARDAVDQMLTEVGHKRLADLPLIDEVRKNLLQKALAFYRKFLDENQDDPALEQETGHAYQRVGDIQHLLGQSGEAEKAYREALVIRERLAAQFPSQPSYRADLAKSQNNLANLLFAIGRRPEAEAFFRRALEAWSGLAAEDPRQPDYRDALAATQANLGMVFQETGRCAEADASYGAGLTLWKELLAQSPGSPIYREHLARCDMLLGRYLIYAGRLDEAEASFQESRELYEHLVADFAARPDYREQSGELYRQLGILHEQTNRQAEAAAAYRRCMEIHQRLVAEFPARPNYRQWLARDYHTEGTRLQAAGELPKAEVAYRRAVDLQEALVADVPAQPAYRRDLAACQSDLANLLREVGHFEEAEALYRQALAIQVALVEEFPKSPHHRCVLANTHLSVGLLFQETGRLADAGAADRQALAVQQPLVDEFPTVPAYQSQLGAILNNWAKVLGAQGHWEEARAHLERAIAHQQLALQAKPKYSEYRRFLRNHYEVLTDTLIHLGKHGDAVRAAANLADVFPEDPNDAYLAAQGVAGCLDLAAKDQALSLADREALARTYRDQALALLHRAVRQGYRDLGRLKEDPTLRALRPSQEFRELLNDLEARRPPTAPAR